MAINVPEAEEVAFTLVSNKKHKEKGKVSFLPSMSFSNSRSKTSLILWALSFQSCDNLSSLKTSFNLSWFSYDTL